MNVKSELLHIATSSPSWYWFTLRISTHWQTWVRYHSCCVASCKDMFRVARNGCDLTWLPTVLCIFKAVVRESRKVIDWLFRLRHDSVLLKICICWTFDADDMLTDDCRDSRDWNSIANRSHTSSTLCDGLLANIMKIVRKIATWLIILRCQCSRLFLRLYCALDTGINLFRRWRCRQLIVILYNSIREHVAVLEEKREKRDHDT